MIRTVLCIAGFVVCMGAAGPLIASGHYGWAAVSAVSSLVFIAIEVSRG